MKKSKNNIKANNLMHDIVEKEDNEEDTNIIKKTSSSLDITNSNY